ncbi:MAG: class I SAM-dependent methyltransferase [Erysipelotrichia bacterium]|nr:class I SAM-dependent methyltransferase [Erysipelotrichia bacterium]NCC54283.1 class I SAM-dependent methyltransferase [Erysipelotrichia bacterium]
MIYNILAKYYDGLVKDEAATMDWVQLIEKHIKKKELLELACGSGEITLKLAADGYHIDASDLSSAMIEEAKKKPHAKQVHFFVMDMLEYHVDKTYDGILCLCDSINYLLLEHDLATLFKNVYDSLNEDGVFIFDTHSLDRLIEFEEEFYEEGIVEGHEYTWSIIADKPYLYHNFVFYDEEARMFQEQHIQRVYEPELLASLLAPYFTFEVVSDFIKEGICEGEKYFYICKKKGSHL